MRPDRVEVPPPAFDDDLGFLQRVEDFAAEKFVAQTCIEALDVAVLPWTAWCDVGGLRANSSNPFLHGLRHELRPIVRTNLPGHAAQNEEIGQHIDDVDGLELAGNADRQAFVGELGTVRISV